MTAPKRTVLCLLLAIGAADASARGVTPYLPLNLAPEVERQIERVLILAGKPVLKRPIAAAMVLEALPKACEADPVLCRQVRIFLGRYMEPRGVAFAGAELAVADDANPLPNRHGMSSDSAWAVSGAAFWRPNDYMSLSLGGIAYDGNASASGTMLSVGFEYAQLDLGFRDHWLSPATDSAMLIGTNAASMPSITLSNYQPITRLGLHYELFLARMEDSDRIAHLDGFTSGSPHLAGIHLQVEPFPGWSLAANRLVQFGGGARGGVSFSDFWRALLRPHDFDNRSASLDREQELGNQVGAWTSRFIFPGRVPFTVYFEYAGEDSSYSGNYRLGNAALSGGMQFPRLWRRYDLTLEASEWQNAWYVHGIYGDGLTNDGRVLGHWGADYRVPGDGVGARSAMVRLAWEPWFGGFLETQYRTLSNEAYTDTQYERAHMLAVRYSRPWQQFLVGVELTAGRDSFGEKFGRLAGFVHLSDQWLQRGGGSEELTPPVRPAGAEIFVDAGVHFTEVLARLGDGSENATTRDNASPHFGIGARRAVTKRSDLGVRLDFDRVDHHMLVAVRALDYRYRIGRHFAAGGFIGAARYDLGTPAYGYYLGVGVQWRDVVPGWDVGVDLRFYDKVARDKLLPEDPAPTPRPDVFYDIYGAAVSLSYRW